MNWIKENKFLSGFLVVMAIGIGAGAWFILGAKGRYDEATTNYQSKVGELNRLQKLPIAPNQKNLDKILAQQGDVNSEVSALAASLAAQQIPVEELSPESFQDKLRAAVTAVRNKAAQAVPAVALPKENFFLGMQRYETAPPAKEAASVLGRELKAIEWLCNQLIDSKVSAIEALDRQELPEEAGRVKAGAKPVAKATPKPAGGKADKVAKDHDVQKNKIQIVFLTEQSRFRQVLNAIVNYKGQFFIPRLVNVKNEKTEAPKRVAAADPSAPPADPSAVSATPTATSGYIAGEEKIRVTLVLEMIDFSEAPAKEPSK